MNTTNVDRIWLGVSDEDNEGSFININNGERLNLTLRLFFKFDRYIRPNLNSY